METALLISIVCYLILMVGIAFWAQRNVKNNTDFLVAGRRLPLALSSATLLATWFGAGTLLSATDEIRLKGLSITGLEPYGVGACLLIAGLFFAKPLWEMKLLTLSDFYRIKFGKKVETLSVFFTVPAYIGWIAAQMVASAGILQLFFDVSLTQGILIVAAVATFYTLMGGMWSVTITDAIQMALILLGISMVAFGVFRAIGDGSLFAGMSKAVSGAPPEHQVLIPTETLGKFFGWINIFLIASLGNIPGQDLAQRIFSSKSSNVARNSCYIAGFAYMILGSVPVLIGLASQQLLPASVTHSVLPALAKMFLSPAMTIIFVLCLFSVILSTIDSSILAASSVLSENLLRRYVPESVSNLRLCQYCVVGISLLGIVLAFSGTRAYALLESSYAVGLVGLFVPLTAGLYFKVKNEMSCLYAMVVGIGLWSTEFFFEMPVPMSLVAVAGGFITYLLHSGMLAFPFLPKRSTS